MMKFEIVNEQEVIVGENYKQVACSLKNASLFASQENLLTYMRGFAERYKVQTGKKVAYNNASNFIKSLVKAGYLIEKLE